MYKVGKKTLLFEDVNRPNWFRGGNRPLLSEIWYPAAEDTVVDQFSFGSPDPLFKFDAIAIDAEFNHQLAKLPVVLLSHGTGGSALNMGWLGQYLASQGYLAVAVNHHGNNALEPYLARGFLLWWERAIDISVLIDLLLSEGNEFGHRIDETRIGVAGFSLGGYTSIALAGGCCSLEHLQQFCNSADRDSICDGPREFPKDLDQVPHLLESDQYFRDSMGRHQQSYKDNRIKAAFAIAPALGMAFTPGGLADIDIPVQIVVTEIDNEVPPYTNAHRFAELIPAAKLVVLPGGADHYVFLCEATNSGRRREPTICTDHPSVNRREVHKTVQRQAISFFQNELASSHSDPNFNL